MTTGSIRKSSGTKDCLNDPCAQIGRRVQEMLSRGVSRRAIVDLVRVIQFGALAHAASLIDGSRVEEVADPGLEAVSNRRGRSPGRGHSGAPRGPDATRPDRRDVPEGLGHLKTCCRSVSLPSERASSSASLEYRHEPVDNDPGRALHLRRPARGVREGQRGEVGRPARRPGRADRARAGRGQGRPLRVDARRDRRQPADRPRRRRGQPALLRVARRGCLRIAARPDRRRVPRLDPRRCHDRRDDRGGRAGDHAGARGGRGEADEQQGPGAGREQAPGRDPLPKHDGPARGDGRPRPAEPPAR